MTRSSSSCASASAATTSRNSGSPIEPGSFVRSSTAIRRTLGGSASSSARVGNGRYRRSCTTPTRSPWAVSDATVSRTVSAPDPITTITRSASGCPAYSTRRMRRPVRSPSRAIASSTTSGMRA